MVRRPVPWRRLGITLGILGVATPLGFRAARWLARKRMSGYTQLKAEDALESLWQLEAALVEQARGAPGLAALWIVVTLAAVALLVVRHRQWTAAGAPGW